jgi:uncharacterized protein (DUF1800 family)
MAPLQDPSLRFVLPIAAALFVVLSAGNLGAQESPSDRDEIVHVLNRITFGPRPNDVEAVEKMGLHNYIEQQLHPETIDDSALEQQLAGFDLLQMSPQDLAALYFNEIKKNLKKQKAAAAAALATAGPPPTATPPVMEKTAANDQIEPQPPVQSQDKLANLVEKAKQYRSVSGIGELEQAKLVRAVDSQRQLQEVLVDFWGNHFNIDMKKGPDRILKIIDDRDVIRPNIWGSFRELLEASAKSPAMLHYLDNAGNTVAHNVTPIEQMITQRIADKMTENGNGALAPAVPQVGQKKGGINENYAREIMELHTLGVDGGYTQNDVQEVARCFTGWTYDRLTNEFVFRARQHDNGAKVVLGHQIPANGGIQDGEIVLDILAASPATAHHISLELCQRFVSDDPPSALVDRIAGVFRQSGGNLRSVTEAILTSPEFLSPSNYNNKIKSPLEFAVSAVRASESSIVPQQPPPYDKLVPAIEGAGVLGRGAAADRISKRPRQSLNWHILELGEPLFACTPPTGYNEVSKFWVSPGALIERLNFALALTQQQVSDIKFDPQTILAGTDLDRPDAVLNQSVAVLLQNNITPSTRKVLEQTAVPAPGESKTVNPSKLIALIIGSPEFQRK